MAATVAFPFPQEANQSIGSFRGTLIRVTLATNDYLTGGISVASKLPSGDVLGAVVIGNTGTGCVTQVPSFDATAKKLQLVKGTAGVNAEVSNGSSDAQVVTLIVFTA